MNLRFDDVMPFPLKEFKHSDRSIWGNSIEFNSGTHNVLNATSGKGKSTFTGIIAGIRTDYTGQFFLEDQDQKSFDKTQWSVYLQRQLSFVFQDLQLFPELTVGENLMLKNNLTQHKTEQEIKALLDSVGLTDRWNDPCKILSMGQQQRVAIIRALCQPFSWLIMDEPFSHLDDENSSICLKLISEESKKQQAGFVLTTLNPELRYSFDQHYYL